MKKNRFKLQRWLESHAVTPDYSGGLLIGLSIFFNPPNLMIPFWLLSPG